MERDRFEHLQRHVEASQVEVNRRAKSIPIVEAAGGVLDPLSPRVDSLRSSVGDAVVDRIDDPFGVAFHHPGHSFDGLQAGANRPAIPALHRRPGPGPPHFKPGGAARLLGVSPGKLANDHVGLDDLDKNPIELHEGPRD